MSILNIILCGYLVIALLIAVMVRRAPVGYEDEHGFHRGERPRSRLRSRSERSLSAKF